MSVRGLQGMVGILLAVLLGLALFWQPHPADRMQTAPVPAGGDFTLESARGPVSLKAYAGKVVLVYFGYTYCPDICPTSLATIAAALQQLKPEEQAKVAVLFISVDPQRDTPARLAEYVQFFHPNMLGLTGEPAVLADIAKRYGVFYAKQSVATAGDGYVMDHTADTYLVDGQGRLQRKILHDTPPAEMAVVLRSFLSKEQ